MIAREHAVVEGEFTGEVVRDYLHLQTDLGPRFVAQWIDRMGHEIPDNPEDLESVVDAISNCQPTYSASIKRNGDFTNVRERQLIDSGEAVDAEATEKADTDTDADADAGSGLFHRIR